MDFGHCEPPGANPCGLRLIQGDALHMSVYNGMGRTPIGIAHPDRRLALLVIVDKNSLFTVLVGKVTVILARFIAIDSRWLSAVAGVVVGYSEQRRIECSPVLWNVLFVSQQRRFIKSILLELYSQRTR